MKKEDPVQASFGEIKSALEKMEIEAREIEKKKSIINKHLKKNAPPVVEVNRLEVIKKQNEDNNRKAFHSLTFVVTFTGLSVVLFAIYITSLNLKQRSDFASNIVIYAVGIGWVAAQVANKRK